MRSAPSLLLALAMAACSKGGAAPSGVDGGEDASCGPAPETLSVPSEDCVAASPNPCCAGFTLFSCTGADAGSTCSETTSCVRAARYDESVCRWWAGVVLPAARRHEHLRHDDRPRVRAGRRGPAERRGAEVVLRRQRDHDPGGRRLDRRRGGRGGLGRRDKDTRDAGATDSGIADSETSEVDAAAK